MPVDAPDFIPSAAQAPAPDFIPATPAASPAPDFIPHSVDSLLHESVATNKRLKELYKNPKAHSPAVMQTGQYAAPIDPSIESHNAAYRAKPRGTAGGTMFDYYDPTHEEKLKALKEFEDSNQSYATAVNEPHRRSEYLKENAADTTKDEYRLGVAGGMLARGMSVGTRFIVDPVRQIVTNTTPEEAAEYREADDAQVAARMKQYPVVGGIAHGTGRALSPEFIGTMVATGGVAPVVEGVAANVGINAAKSAAGMVSMGTAEDLEAGRPVTGTNTLKRAATGAVMAPAGALGGKLAGMAASQAPEFLQPLVRVAGGAASAGATNTGIGAADTLIEEGRLPTLGEASEQFAIGAGQHVAGGGAFQDLRAQQTANARRATEIAGAEMVTRAANENVQNREEVRQAERVTQAANEAVTDRREINNAQRATNIANETMTARGAPEFIPFDEVQSANRIQENKGTAQEAIPERQGTGDTRRENLQLGPKEKSQAPATETRQVKAGFVSKAGDIEPLPAPKPRQELGPRKAEEPAEQPPVVNADKSVTVGGAPEKQRYYRESSPDRVRDLLKSDRTLSNLGRSDPTYFSSSKDLALGQGDNKGVHLEFEPGFRVSEDTSKPSAAFAAAQGHKEFVSTEPAKVLRDHLSAITVTKAIADTFGDPLSVNSGLGRQLKRLEAEGWTRTETPEGVRFEKAAAKPESPKVANEPEPELAEMYSGVPMPKVLKELNPDVRGAINTVIGEISAPLQKHAPGRHVVRQLDEVSNKAASLVGKLENEAHDAITQLPLKDQKWLSESDPLGYSNYQKMREDTPSGRIAAPNPKIKAIDDATQKMMDLTGDEAERVGIPRGDGTPFKKATSGRFLRNFTPDAIEAIRNGGGPLLDAIERVIVRDNPGTTPKMAKDMLEAIRSPDPIKHIGALEKVRTIKNLPTYVEVNGQKYPILETDPSRAILGAARAQARRIYFYEKFGDDQAVAQLRARYVQDGGNGRDFDNTIAVANGRTLGGQYDPHSVGVRLVRSANSLVSAGQTSLSAIPNIPQTAVQVPRYTGVANYIRAIGQSLMHPKATAREIAAYGAMHRSIMDWTVQDGRRLEDYTRIITGAATRLTGAHWVAQFNNMVSGAAFRNLADSWQKHGFTDADKSIAKDLRLTPPEITALRAGKMTPELREKIIQNGVKITQFVTEDPHRSSRFQHSRLAGAVFSYQNYAIGTAKATGRMVETIRDSVKSGDKKRMADAGRQLMAMLAGSVGAGLLTIYARRAVKRDEILRDDEESLEMLGKALWETQLLGPSQRMLDLGNDRSVTDTAINLSPKARFIFDFAAALAGKDAYEATPESERPLKFLGRNIPIVKAGTRWAGESPVRRSAAYRETSKILGSKIEYHGTPEDTLDRRREDEIIKLVREKKYGDAKGKIAEGAKAGKLDIQDVKRLVKESKSSDLVNHVKRLKPEDTPRIWSLATDQEKAELRKVFAEKIKNSRLPVEKKAELLKQIR